MPYQCFSDDFLKSIIGEALKTSHPGQWNVTRHYMYTKLRDMLRNFDGPDKTCLSVSHSDFLARLLGLVNSCLIRANYPEHDLLSLKYPSAAFDFCVSDQVLEHVQGNPFAVFEESLRVIKAGGFIVHTSCFLNEIHNMPNDYWRFTPEALCLMAEQSGANVIESGGWGNKDVWAFMALGFRTVPVPNDPSHPICRMAMEKDDAMPIVTWVVAQKQSS